MMMMMTADATAATASSTATTSSIEPAQDLVANRSKRLQMAPNGSQNWKWQQNFAQSFGYDVSSC